MLRRLSRPALGALLALGLAVALGPAAGAGAGAHARAAAGPFLAGVNIESVERVAHLPEIDRSLAAAHRLHAQVVRVEVPWSVLEPTAAGQLDPGALAYTDRIAADASALGIKIVMMVQSTPCWASSAPRTLMRRCHPARATAANSWPPARVGDFAAFVAFLAKRYGPNLAALEIWNEPDQANEDYFAGPAKPERYAALLRAAYPAIKQADPSVKVLGGSLVGSNGVFLRALYKAGIKGYYDGLSVHYYNLTLASLRSIHEVQLANGDPIPLWLAEFGWTSCWPKRKIEQEQACVPSRVQAENIANAYRLLIRTPYVASGVLYKLRDSRREEFGVLTFGWAHKSSFSALAHALASPFAPVTPVRLQLHGAGPSAVATGSAAVGDFMVLEAFSGTLLRYRALFILDRFNRFSITLPAVLGRSGLRVRVYRYATGRAGAAQSSL